MHNRIKTQLARAAEHELGATHVALDHLAPAARVKRIHSAGMNDRLAILKRSADAGLIRDVGLHDLDRIRAVDDSQSAPNPIGRPRGSADLVARVQLQVLEPA